MGKVMFEFRESLGMAFAAIRANKARTVLTTLGIVIGITAVVLMSTAIKGIDKAFLNGVSTLGSDNLYVDKFSWFSNDVPFWKVRNRRNLKMKDFRKFKELARLPLAVAPTLWTQQTLKFGDKSIDNLLITGTNNEFMSTTNLTLDYGRFFNEMESNAGRNVIVVGYEVAEKIFPNGNALDKYVKVKGNNFKVVGILTKQGSTMMGAMNPDKMAYMPISCIFKYFQSEDFRSVTINVRARNAEAVEDTKEEARGIMRQIRGLNYKQEDDFSINQQEGLLKEINKTVDVIQIAGYFITGLSLFVGAIGIMNIMFVSVKERTREIGTRKAIGATKRTILMQFLIESSIICLMGGAIGLFFAFLGTMIINQFLPTSIQLDSVIIAFLISAITGVLSGFAPAYKAAKLDPVEALRYE